MLVPLIEFQFNPGSGGGTGSSSSQIPPLQFYSISKQVQPFLIMLLTAQLFLLPVLASLG
jgi:hypothetical protein